MTRNILNRRELLLLGGATACSTILVLPTTAHAVIPPPPPSAYLLIFIANGIYQISGFYTVTLPASAGTCQNYSANVVSQAFAANFSYTGRSGSSVWNAIIGAPLYKWWEMLDRRNGRYIRVYEGDRIEVRFADKSRVKLVFYGRYAAIPFKPLVGTERLPDGTRLYERDGRDGYGGGGGGKGRDGDGAQSVIGVTPGIAMFAWHWSSQQTPW